MSSVEERRASYPVMEMTTEASFDRDTVGFLASLAVHVGLLFALGFLTYFHEDQTRDALTIFTSDEESLEE